MGLAFGDYLEKIHHKILQIQKLELFTDVMFKDNYCNKCSFHKKLGLHLAPIYS